MSVARPIDKALACFDALPREVRNLLNDAPISFDPVDAYAFFQQRAPLFGMASAATLLRQRIEAVTAMELAKFAEDYQRDHRLPLPHVAAGILPLRG